jgi:hypothetical protein
MYAGEIIQFIGGVQQYIGEMAQEPHPNGKGWYRILNPCTPSVEQDGNDIRLTLTRIWGMDRLYQKFVDIYCPDDSLKEVRVLDKAGGLYKGYMAELTRAEFGLIRPPGSSELTYIHKGRQ